MKFLRNFFRRRRGAPDLPSDFFDVYHAETLRAAGLSAIEPTIGESESLGAGVREFYLHTPEAQWRYPLGLLPVGQKRFAKWLLGKARAQHHFSTEEILAFLHATAADLPRHLELTYLINPNWQQKFPVLTEQGKELIIWLRSEFPKFRALRKVKALPESARPSSPKLEGVNFLGHFCYPSGLQQAALGYCESLEEVGLRTSRRDVPTGVRTELEPREPWLGLEIFPVTITNVSPAPHFELLYERAGLVKREGVRRIAYWAWELENVPNEWTQLAKSIDEIWTPTPFVAEAMRRVMPLPVHDILPGVAIGKIQEISRDKFGIGAGEFVFLFMFDMLSGFDRKNPIAIVRAFRSAFRPEDRATLLIKISRGAADAEAVERLRSEVGGAKVIVVDELVSRAEAYGYIALADAVISLHRSEGFGLLMAEAMLLAKPVIATNYSGNTSFMHEENSLLVDYEMTEVKEDGPIYTRGNRWANPSEARAAEFMRLLFKDRKRALEIGHRGRMSVAPMLSLEAAGARMKARLLQLGLFA